MRAVLAIAAEHGLPVGDPVVLSDSFNLRVHLRPAPVVARVPTVTALARPRPADALERELAKRLAKEAGTQAVHGDAHPGNLLATPAGLLWNDFEETMAAPVGWDLACLLRSRLLDGRAAVPTYGADPGELRTFLAARGFQGTVWVLVRALHMPAARAALDAWLSDPSGERRG